MRAAAEMIRPDETTAAAVHNMAEMIIPNFQETTAHISAEMIVPQATDKIPIATPHPHLTCNAER